MLGPDTGPDPAPLGPQAGLRVGAGRARAHQPIVALVHQAGMARLDLGPAPGLLHRPAPHRARVAGPDPTRQHALTVDCGQWQQLQQNLQVRAQRMQMRTHL